MGPHGIVSGALRPLLPRLQTARGLLIPVKSSNYPLRRRIRRLLVVVVEGERSSFDALDVILIMFLLLGSISGLHNQGRNQDLDTLMVDLLSRLADGALRADLARVATELCGVRVKREYYVHIGVARVSVG
ncbi:hypothetical protein B0I37DRAFT_354719 [Chaetomium sp. MPI-CAGE-AT-0009]|nr:hypothetical protein B0I37DRAFT_354719 [Chaetomium sp. MPI-CAGE-AT-0009]